VIVEWTGTAQVASVLGDPGDSFTQLAPVQEGAGHSLTGYAAFGVKAQPISLIAVRLQGSPNEVFVWSWLLPTSLGGARLATETATVGPFHAPFELPVAAASAPQLALLTCVGCQPVISAGASMITNNLRIPDDSIALSVIEPSPAGTLSLSSEFGNGSWLMDVMIFGP
jgi:hypothetical protein